MPSPRAVDAGGSVTDCGTPLRAGPDRPGAPAGAVPTAPADLPRAWSPAYRRPGPGQTRPRPPGVQVPPSPACAPGVRAGP